MKYFDGRTTNFKCLNNDIPERCRNKMFDYICPQKFLLALSVTTCTTFPFPTFSIVVKQIVHFGGIRRRVASIIGTEKYATSWRIQENIDDQFSISCCPFIHHNEASILVLLHSLFLNNLVDLHLVFFF